MEQRVFSSIGIDCKCYSKTVSLSPNGGVLTKAMIATIKAMGFDEALIISNKVNFVDINIGNHQLMKAQTAESLEAFIEILKACFYKTKQIKKNADLLRGINITFDTKEFLIDDINCILPDGSVLTLNSKMVEGCYDLKEALPKPFLTEAVILTHIRGYSVSCTDVHIKVGCQSFTFSEVIKVLTEAHNHLLS